MLVKQAVRILMAMPQDADLEMADGLPVVRFEKSADGTVVYISDDERRSEKREDKE